jgi:GT2 family glycosyltransferase
MMALPNPIVTIPTYLRTEEDVDVTIVAVKSVRDTQGEKVNVLLVDDGSPEPELVDRMEKEAVLHEAAVHRKKENGGFSSAVNIGLELARDQGRDAILMNADMEVTTPNWLTHFRGTTDDHGEKAAVVGALLLYPNGLIQHGGVYFSLLTRTFDHFYKYAPGNLPEALEKRVCPVTAAFQFIRHDTLERVGVYDDSFKMGWEDMDYCIRTFLAGERCVYNPNVRGFHHEMMFRGRPDPKIADWQAKSFLYLTEKYREQSFAEFVPFW